jgi:cytochrome c peroxidase
LPADNPLTQEGVALGEKLFADVRLSSNGTQSCASCHAPAHAFSDTVALSRGADGATGTRNAMPLVNLAWNPNFAWDGSQPKIRDQARAAWTNPIEMHADIERVVAVLAKDTAMTKRFAAAFGTPAVTADRVTLALEQFLLTQVSADAKFDRALRGQAELTDLEKRGFELFTMEFDPAHGRRGADCFHCHGGPLFSDFAMKNTGLDAVSADLGRERVTGKASDHGKFKTPTLRNVAVTGPYMHDGRFRTLEEVVAHYDHGVQRTAVLDPNLAKHPADGMKLGADDQRALVAFLRTLTDARFARGDLSRSCLEIPSLTVARPVILSPAVAGRRIARLLPAREHHSGH